MRSSNFPSSGIGPWWFGMRPIGAPHDAIGKLANQLARERHSIGIGRAGARDAVAAAHLHPELVAVHEPQELLERRLLEPERCVDAADVVDDDGHG